MTRSTHNTQVQVPTLVVDPADETAQGRLRRLANDYRAEASRHPKTSAIARMLVADAHACICGAAALDRVVRK